MNKKGKYFLKDKESTLFLGIKSSYRKRLFYELKRNIIINIDLIGPNSFINLNNNIKDIYRYKIGINHHAENYKFHTSWHRIMMYMANDVAVLSQDKLDPEFVNGRDYLYYKNIKTLCNAIKIMEKDYEKISRSARKKMEKNFYMPNLFKKAFSKYL